jgi:hypothetical protein
MGNRLDGKVCIVTGAAYVIDGGTLAWRSVNA